MVGSIDLWSVLITTKELVLIPLSCMFFHEGHVVQDSILVQCKNLSLVTAMSTGSTKDANNYVAAQKFACIFLGMVHYLVETGHAQHERHTVQEFLTTCPSTIKPEELLC